MMRRGRGIVWTVGCLVVLVSAAGQPAGAQEVVPLDPDDAAAGRLILSTGVSTRDPVCPARAYQFALDPEDDPEWRRANRSLWEEEEVISAVRRAMALARSALPFDGVVVCLGLSGRPSDPTLERMKGISGAAFVPKTIFLVVAPSMNPDWLADLEVTVAHEYHHLATQRPAPTGLHVLIREGLAHNFAARLYPDRIHPSADALRPDQIAPAWEKILAHLDDEPRSFLRTYMFGGPYYGGEVPGWAGYTLGYCLVWAYAQTRPGISPAELSEVPPSHFVEREARCPAGETG
ncbi:MAG: DUF2268 domain-containing putative Zn-dependent protease [Gemmatimonadota bacterium]